MPRPVRVPAQQFDTASSSRILSFSVERDVIVLVFVPKKIARAVARAVLVVIALIIALLARLRTTMTAVVSCCILLAALGSGLPGLDGMP
eukprot:scaffold128331_cov43-Prasinocladus_malaysianus.AAC.3